jgi:hypothetical protein
LTEVLPIPSGLERYDRRRNDGGVLSTDLYRVNRVIHTAATELNPTMIILDVVFERPVDGATDQPPPGTTSTLTSPGVGGLAITCGASSRLTCLEISLSISIAPEAIS